VQPKDLAAVEDMSMNMLKQEINKSLEELANKEEIFVIMIDAINQVIGCFPSLNTKFSDI